MRFSTISTLAVVCGLVPALASAAVSIQVQTSNPTPVVGGAAFSYTITMTNGASLATDVAMTDPLPPGANFANVSVGGTNAASFSCVGPAAGTNGTVVCESPSFIANGTAVVTIVAAYSPDLAGGVRTNSARVVSGGAASVASVQQTIQNDADLALFMSTQPTVIASNNLVYEIAVENTGDSSGVNVRVVDTLPPNTSFVSVAGTGAFHDDCADDPVTNAFGCSATFLRTGSEDITLIVKTARKPKTGLVTNTATLQAGVGVVNGSPASASATLVRK